MRRKWVNLSSLNTYWRRHTRRTKTNRAELAETDRTPFETERRKRQRASEIWREFAGSPFYLLTIVYRYLRQSWRFFFDFLLGVWGGVFVLAGFVYVWICLLLLLLLLCTGDTVSGILEERHHKRARVRAAIFSVRHIGTFCNLLRLDVADTRGGARAHAFTCAPVICASLLACLPRLAIATSNSYIYKRACVMCVSRVHKDCLVNST